MLTKPVTMFLINDATTPVSLHEALLHASHNHFVKKFSFSYDGFLNPGEFILKGCNSTGEGLVSKYTFEGSMDNYQYFRIFGQVAMSLAQTMRVFGIERHPNFLKRVVERRHSIPPVSVGGVSGLKYSLAIIAGYRGDIDCLLDTSWKEVIEAFVKYIEQPSFDDLILKASKSRSLEERSILAS